MPIDLLIKGFILGVAIAAPVGPIGVLCIRRTLSHGRASGLVSGLGAATADTLYGAAAAFGLSFVSGALMRDQRWVRLLGGLGLLALGVHTMRAKPTRPAGERSTHHTLAGDYASAFALTLANPATLIAFAAIFAGLGLAEEGIVRPALIVAGVFVGSGAWWFFLTSTVGRLHGHLRTEHIGLINLLSGTLISCFGALALLSALL
ncbi:MAG: LysE family transporter [Elusimicrobia bacterium]|nr:LysE family transporter [Elusimicrobiota bacterium]